MRDLLLRPAPQVEFSRDLLSIAQVAAMLAEGFTLRSRPYIVKSELSGAVGKKAHVVNFALSDFGKNGLSLKGCLNTWHNKDFLYHPLTYKDDSLLSYAHYAQWATHAVAWRNKGAMLDVVQRKAAELYVCMSGMGAWLSSRWAHGARLRELAECPADCVEESQTELVASLIACGLAELVGWRHEIVTRWMLRMSPEGWRMRDEWGSKKNFRDDHDSDVITAHLVAHLNRQVILDDLNAQGVAMQVIEGRGNNKAFIGRELSNRTIDELTRYL